MTSRKPGGRSTKTHGEKGHLTEFMSYDLVVEKIFYFVIRQSFIT